MYSMYRYAHVQGKLSLKGYSKCLKPFLRQTTVGWNSRKTTTKFSEIATRTALLLLLFRFLGLVGARSGTRPAPKIFEFLKIFRNTYTNSKACAYLFLFFFFRSASLSSTSTGSCLTFTSERSRFEVWSLKKGTIVNMTTLEDFKWFSSRFRSTSSLASLRSRAWSFSIFVFSLDRASQQIRLILDHISDDLGKRNEIKSMNSNKTKYKPKEVLQ